MIFQYWSNKAGWHTELLFTWEGDSILDADEQFQKATNLDPRRTAWIGCVVIHGKRSQ